MMKTPHLQPFPFDHSELTNNGHTGDLIVPDNHPREQKWRQTQLAAHVLRIHEVD